MADKWADDPFKKTATSEARFCAPRILWEPPSHQTVSKGAEETFKRAIAHFLKTGKSLYQEQDENENYSGEDF